MYSIHMTHAYIFLTQSYIFRVTKCFVWSIKYIGLYFKIKADVYGYSQKGRWTLDFISSYQGIDCSWSPCIPHLEPWDWSFLFPSIFLFCFVLFPSVYILCYFLFSSNHLFTEMVITKKKERKKFKNDWRYSTVVECFTYLVCLRPHFSD